MFARQRQHQAKQRLFLDTPLIKQTNSHKEVNPNPTQTPHKKVNLSTTYPSFEELFQSNFYEDHKNLSPTNQTPPTLHKLIPIA